ncbi:MAG: hypothetical protein V7603_6299 [Micromonosporaceae bacterium]
MQVSTAALAVLLPLTLLFAALAGWPVGPAIAPVRLAIMRGGLVVGTVTVLATEGLGALHQLTGAALAAVWATVAASCGVLAGYRHRWRLPRKVPAALRGTAWPDLVLVAGMVVLVLAELVVALVAPPNNADSQGYHLPRVEHWAQDRSVAFYPTAVHRQIGFSPGAEYLLLQLRLLAGPEEFYNVVQWAAALGCAVVVSRIAAQLGAGRRGQLLAAVTVASAPLVVLEATSTQTDLVAGFWVATGASLALSGLRARTPWVEVGWLGAASGLTAITKVNALATLAPFLLMWGAGQVGRVRPGRAALRCAAVVALTAALAGPFTARCAREWGTPTGDPGAQIIALGRHDPAAVGVNAARIAASVLATGSARLNRETGAALDALAAALHLPARDAALTFTGLPFEVPTPRHPDEDHSAYPIQAMAVLGGVAFGLFGRRRTAQVRGYAGAAALALLLTAALVAWQPWINRLVLPTFVAGVPLVGWAASHLRDSRSRSLGADPRRPVAAMLAALVLLAGYRQAVAALWYGQPRPLGTKESVLAVGRDRVRYVRARDRQAGYEAAAARLAASGARRIGLVQSNVGWEYAWWEGPRRYGAHPALVSLTSVLPRHPPASVASVDAIVCTLDTARCARWLPGGWYAIAYRGVSVLLPGPPAIATIHKGR